MEDVSDTLDGLLARLEAGAERSGRKDAIDAILADAPRRTSARGRAALPQGTFRRTDPGRHGRTSSASDPGRGRSRIGMTIASLLDSAGTLLPILTPLVAVPLTVITFYLRSLREHQVAWHAELVRRVESIEAALADLRKTVTDFERDYTRKEEWVREYMLARRTLERLRETTVRLDAALQARARIPPERLGAGTGGAPQPEEEAAGAAMISGRDEGDE